MFRKVLVGLDGSATAWQAFRRAITLARRYCSELWAVSVEEDLPHLAATVGEFEDEKARENEYFARVQAMARELAEEQEVPVQTLIIAGRASDRLIRLAGSSGFDLIVVGHRGHTSPWHRLVGSTADRIVDHAPCCVLVVRQPASKPLDRPTAASAHPGSGDTSTARPILVAFDGSPSAWRALRLGSALARDNATDLWVVWVDEPRPPHLSSEPATKQADEVAAFEQVQVAVARELGDLGLALHTRVVQGHAAQAIVATANEIGAGLIVVGRHGHISMVDRLLGSTPDRVVDLATCSVLVCP